MTPKEVLEKREKCNHIEHGQMVWYGLHHDDGTQDIDLHCSGCGKFLRAIDRQ